MKTIALMSALAFLMPAVVAQGDAEAHFKELTAELAAERAAFSAAIRKVQASDEYKSALDTYRNGEGEEKAAALKKLRSMTSSLKRPNPSEAAPKFAAGAKKYAGTDGAVPFLVWLATQGGKDHTRSAVETLMAKHAGSAKLGDFVDRLPYMTRSGFSEDEIRGYCAKIIDTNENAEIKAGAHYARAQTYLARGRNPEPKPGFEDAYKKDIAAVKAVAPNSILAKRAVAPEFERTRLQIGMVAPDIVGEDLDGVKFKLSDYRGKVVVLDFWGDW